MTTRIDTRSTQRSRKARPARNEFAGTATEFPSWPACADDEVDAAEQVLRSGKLNYWTGTEGRQFEREFADYVGCRYAVAVANGTVALELALKALEVGVGDEVIVPCRTFVATAFAVSRCGATPVFADVDRNSQNITADTIRRALTPRTRAVIVVHLAGWPCDMDPILELARERKLLVVEDCAQAHGARYKGRAVGALGDVGTFSFCQDKIITTAGEGGMLTTQRSDVWKRAWSFKDHGKNYEASHRPASPANFRWMHDTFGTNWRLTEVQSAIGRVALRKLDAWVAARRRQAAILYAGLSSLAALRTTPPPDSTLHSYYKWYAFVHPERLAADWTRERIIDEINRRGVPCFSGSCGEIYLEKAFDPSLRPATRHAVARELGETSLVLLVHPTLTERHVHSTAQAARSVLQQATTAGCAPADQRTID